MKGAPSREPAAGNPGEGADSLLRATAKGDEAAFAELYERHHKPLLSFCRHMLGNVQDGEDALQQTFIRAHRALGARGRDEAHRLRDLVAIGGFFAMMVRLELLTPGGDVMSSETYNKMFTMHGVVMVFFFLIPSIPAVLGNFLGVLLPALFHESQPLAVASDDIVSARGRRSSQRGASFAPTRLMIRPRVAGGELRRTDLLPG